MLLCGAGTNGFDSFQHFLFFRAHKKLVYWFWTINESMCISCLTTLVRVGIAANDYTTHHERYQSSKSSELNVFLGYNRMFENRSCW